VSSPIAAGGRIYLTAASGVRGDRLRLLALEAGSGRKLWERQLAATGSTQCHPKTSMAAPTPVAGAGLVYALFASADVACFDAAGTIVWYRSLARDYPDVSNQVGMAASPVLYRGLLIACLETDSDSFALALDGLTGENRWKVPREKGINWASPILAGGRVGSPVSLVLQSARGVSAYDPETGKDRWAWAGSCESIASPIAAGPILYVPGGGLQALPLGGYGGPTQTSWNSPKLRTSMASPVFYQDRLYAINPAGVLACAGASNGEVLWQERLGGSFSASPVAGDGKLYCANEEGTVSVVDLRAEPRAIASSPLGEPLLASPAITNGMILFRSDRHLYAFGAQASAAAGTPAAQ
jgi:outer membrane protein assembly factor BamB